MSSLATPVPGAELGDAPEQRVALDIARRAVPFTPVVVGLAALVWGAAGAASAAYALVLVVGNLVLAGVLLGWAGRISLGVLMGVALGGYVLRIALIGLAVWPVLGASWVEPVALGTTLIVTHLGLLAWELRYVSLSLAHPGLAPTGGPSNKPSPRKTSPSKENAPC